eukprot:s819_g9.t1
MLRIAAVRWSQRLARNTRSARLGAVARCAPAQGAQRFMSQASNPEGKAPGEADTSAPPATSGASAAAAAAPEPELLYALPLYRKPAFPGFYHVIQIQDAEILDYIVKLRSSDKGSFLAGFLTKELPEGFADSPASEAAAPLLSLPPNQGQAGEKKTRKDTGKVATATDLQEAGGNSLGKMYPMGISLGSAQGMFVGTKLQVVSISKHQGSGGSMVVMPTQRIRRVDTISDPVMGVPLCAVETVPTDESAISIEVRALNHEMVATMKDLLKMQFANKEQFEQVIKYYNLDDPLKLADLAAGMSTAPRSDLQEVLMCEDAVERLRKVLLILKKDLESTRLQSQFRSQIEDKFAKENKKFILMQQLRYIKRELNLERDDKQSIIAAFKESIKKLGNLVPSEAAKAMDQELSKLGNLEPQSAEFNVCRTYLEWLTALPWGKYSEDNTDIDRAEQILNEDHYSLEDVKERILEHIAVSFLKGSVHGKIMCLVGPPGVGKTSIGKSIARAMDRQFYRFSVGGLHDVSEIRGHRRTVFFHGMPAIEDGREIHGNF